MVKEIKAYPILKGVRGRKRADIDTIVKILLDLSKFVTEHPKVKEVDLNPIMVYDKGAKVVDASMILSK